MRSARLLAVVIVAVALGAMACGGDDGNDSANSLSTGGGADDGQRTVEVDVADTAFEPDTLEVSEGQTVRFEFTNTGAITHDAFIGDAAAQENHEREMREAEDQADDMDMGADDGEGGIAVEPGDSGELIYTFDRAGTIEIGCHQPGHYDAGMKVTVDVG
jgi:uncharacterized cupredoxin-like copper-binding protein